MLMQIVSLGLLIGAIVLGYFRKLNVGTVCLGLALILAMIGGLQPKIIYNGFPTKLFVTLLGTMFFFSLLQENGTLELISKKIISMVGKRTFLIPIIIYVVSYLLSAAGPGAISVQSVTIIFAVSLAVQMSMDPILMASLAILGAVGGTTSPIALTGIIVGDLMTAQGASAATVSMVQKQMFLGVSLLNLVCAVVVYVIFKGYKLKAEVKMTEVPKFNFKQKVSLIGLLVLIVLVVGYQFDVGLVAFSVALILVVLNVGDERAALKLIPWGVLILISGVSVLMAITQTMGGIDLLAKILASFMNKYTASPIIGLTAGIMSWFSSANGVVMPTLIPTVPKLIESIGGNVTNLEMIIAIVAGSTVAGISPLSTGGSLIMASFTQETNADEKTQSSLFARLFILSFGMVMIVFVAALVGMFKFFNV